MTWVVSFSMLRPFGPRRLTADQALRHPWFMVGDHELISRNLAKTLDTMRTNCPLNTNATFANSPKRG